MIRASVSNLDLFRIYRDAEEWDLSTFIEKLAWREEGETEEQRAGIALHKALYAGQEGTIDALSANGYTFEFGHDVTLQLDALREIYLSKIYGGLRLGGKLDGWSGNTVRDFKSTGHFDADRFMDSFQWRLYLDMSEADVFRYDVFEIRELDAPQTYNVVNYHPLTVYRYPDMHRDCTALAAEYEQFAMRYLSPEQNREFTAD